MLCSVVTGEEIRRAREELRLTQEDVATALEVSVSSISNWERGKTVPRSRLGALRKFLRIDERKSEGRPTLDRASDLELVQELLTRLNRDGSVEPVLEEPMGFDVPDPRRD